MPYAAHKDYSIAYTRTLLSRSLVLDLPTDRQRYHRRTFDTLMANLRDEFGDLHDELEFTPPWHWRRIRRDEPGPFVKTAAYTKPHRSSFVLIVANWGQSVQTEAVQLDFDALGTGLTHIRRVVDLEDLGGHEHVDDTILLTLPPSDYRVLLVE